MSIYISTGGYKDKKGTEVFVSLKSKGIEKIEFSGGKFIKNFDKYIKDFKNCSQLHNYFPPPKKSFVFNLSSKNKLISKASINLVKKNIIRSKKIGAKYYSYHAGFRVDPRPKDLGKKFEIKKIVSKKQAEDIFLKRLIKLNKLAKKNNVKLLIENNVINKKNLRTFKTNPLLLTSPSEILSFFKKLKSHKLDIGLLLDVAHLKVSSKTLGFNLQKAHKDLNEIITAYHLSDNNGLIDSNKEFNNRSWFWKNLKKNAKFFTIEVYNVNYKSYLNLINILKSKLRRNEKFKKF
jgi:sugar phosphate isomerase/epimerase